MTTALVLFPPTVAFAENQSNFTGEQLMVVSGESTNKHVTANYAWLTSQSEGYEIYVAFKFKDAAAAWGKDLQQIGYNGLLDDANKNVNYWRFDKGSNLTVNEQLLDNNAQWLVVNFGVQALTDPFAISLKFDAGGFDVQFDVSVNLLTVIYDPNGGEGVLTDPITTYDTGQQVTVLANDGAFTKEGHSFVGWNTEPNGQGDEYAEGDTFPMPDYNVVLYAQWAPRTLTITAVDKGKIYGEEFTGYDYEVDGIDSNYPVNITNVSFSSDGADGAASVGTYTIEPSNAVGEGLDEYEVQYVTGTLSVTPRAIEVTADDLSKIYGDTDPALTYQITNGELVNGDEFSGSLMRVAGEDVGLYAIQQGTLVLTDNYTLTFIEGELEITGAELPKTGVNENKYYVFGLMAMLLGVLLAVKSKSVTI